MGYFMGKSPSKMEGLSGESSNEMLIFQQCHLRLPGKFAVNKQYNVYNVK